MKDYESVVREIFKTIKQTADRDARGDNEDFNPNDYAGGNIDDAYDIGQYDGEIYFARELIRMFDKAPILEN